MSDNPKQDRQSPLAEHDWDAVQKALYALQADTEEREPHAVNFLAALQEVLDGLPFDHF